MADWHLKELDDALSASGWRVIAVHLGDDRQISSSWEVQRSTKFPSVFVDFEGLDDMDCSPLELAYACRLSDLPSVSLCFGGKSGKWIERVRAFVDALDYSENDFTLIYDIHHGGSRASARLYPGPKRRIDLTYIGPGLIGLATAVIEVLRNSESLRVACCWLDELGEMRWVLRRSGAQVSIRLFEFPRYSPHVADEEGELYFETECSLLRLATQVDGQIQRAARDFAETGYRTRWRNEASSEAREELSRLIAEHRSNYRQVSRGGGQY